MVPGEKIKKTYTKVKFYFLKFAQSVNEESGGKSVWGTFVLIMQQRASSKLLTA